MLLEIDNQPECMKFFSVSKLWPSVEMNSNFFDIDENYTRCATETPTFNFFSENSHWYQCTGISLYHITFLTTFRRRKRLLKTLREKKKMLVTGIFFFSYNVFNLAITGIFIYVDLFWCLHFFFQFGLIHNYIVP